MSKETQEFVKKVMEGNKDEAKKSLVSILKRKILTKMRSVKES